MPADHATLVSVSEAATILNVNRQRVHQFLKAGRLSARPIGKQLVLERAEVEAFAAIPRPRDGSPLSRPLT